MDDVNNIINFEQLLKKNTSSIRPSALYKTTDLNQTTIKPQDVLHTVYSQIKTIQMADRRSSKYVGKELSNVKSSFLAVNKLPLYNKAQKQTNTFETQCFSDTQLINIVEDAEALIVTHKGMTQEFDTAFTHTNKESETIIPTEKISRETMSETQEFETSFTHTNIDETVSFLEDRIEREGINPCDQAQTDHTQPDGNEIATKNIHDTKNVDKLKEICENVLKENQFFAQNNKQRMESLKEDLMSDSLDIDNNEERSPSPILKVKGKLIPSPMVVPLDSFERFERIAIPLINNYNDFDTCKHLINSQILGGELVLNTDEDVIFNENCPLSPILEKSCDMFQDNTEEPIKISVTNLGNLDSSDKQSESLKDEILFSSDEENDFIYREFQDMPLTAALETSFCDHSDVLEKTMYVCFQTASNKSIKISTDLFQKAQFILEEDDNIDGKNFSLAELVNICDEKSFNNAGSADMEVQDKVNPAVTLVINSDHDMSQAELEKNTSNKDGELIEDVKTKVSTAVQYDDTVKKPPEKTCFVGFKTASNKKINLTDKAFDHGKKVFKDIDFDKDIDVIIQDNLVTMNEDVKVTKSDKNELENDIDHKINDALLIQEFENIEMSFEEKEKSYYENNPNHSQGLKKESNKNIDTSDVAKAKTRDDFQKKLGNINESFDDCDSVNKKDVNVLPELLQKEIINVENYSETKPFMGFKTANNKNIEISANALAKTKIIFEDLGKTVRNKAMDISQPSTSKTEFMGFKTANNRDIKISEKALSKSSKMFNEINKENSKEFENEVEMAKSLFEGFKTASIKNVDITKKNLPSSKLFRNTEGSNIKTETPSYIFRESPSFGDLDKTLAVSKEFIVTSKKCDNDLKTKVSPDTNDNQPCIDEPKTQIPTFKGFQTANKKPVSVSANALEKSKKIFQDIDINKSQYQLNNVSESKFKGFQTASNKEVTVAKEAVEASKKLLDEIQLDQKSPFAGFKTASNKNVKVSKEAIAKCKKFFDDIDDITTETLVTKEVLIKPFVFQTANSNKIEVSRSSLNNTNNIIEDLIPEITEQKTFNGFQTASDKKVLVSKDAFEKSKALFKDIDETGLKDPFMGFQTRNKTKVEVSKEAMESTKQLFQDLDVPINEQGTFKGFQTASKKKVHVSEQALAKTKPIFKDIDTHAKEETENKNSEKREEKPTNKGMFSFQTGNNKNVDVSEDALIKSKKLLEYSNDNKTKSPVDNINLDEQKTCGQKELKLDKDLNLGNIINTQVRNHFENSLCTEDFKETPRNKRSGSPILSCPKAKRKKRFETPYKDEKVKKTDDAKTTDSKKDISTTKIKFTENYKKNKIYTLKDINKINNTEKTDIIDIVNVNLDNILDFEFRAHRNDVTDTKMSIDELKKAFLSAINANLVPEGWLDNHIKLILWKLFSYEVRFRSYSFLCTAQSVIDQLKYRYDKELYNAERPALRKILERDDVPTKPMVLCVAGIYVDGVSVSSVANTNDVELLLTDGWYFIKATIDKMLNRLVYERRIAIGCKILTCGAELVNCEQGMAPWENTSAVRLKIFGNSTRPAPWDAILGFYRVAILNQLSTVKVDGGKIGRLRAYVTRVYPLLYVEKFEDGSTVTRSERLEHLHQIKCESERELVVERIYEEVQKEFSDQESQDSDILDSGKRKHCDSGSQIAKMMKISKDPAEFRAQLTSSQVDLLQEHTCKYQEKVLQAIQDRIQEKVTSRNVVTLARGRIASLNNKMELTKGMLSIWKPNDAILDIFKEGSWIEVMNTMPTAVRYSEIQISAGRQSVFRATKSRDEDSSTLQSLKRRCFKIDDVTQNPTMTTDYNEIDTVGMVFLIEPNNRDFESNRNFQNVYLADADKNIISMNFWGGLKKFGFENILDTGQVVACANLQKRAGNTGKNIPQFRVTEFSHFTKTPKNVRAREMVDDLDKKLFGLDRRKFCDDCIAIKNNYAALRCINNSENESPYRFHKGDYSLARNKMFIETPFGVKSNKKDDGNLNLTGLDFESSFKQDTQELSPRTLLRKKKVCEKIAKLKLYGEPPPLGPINIIDRSVNAKNSYKSPLVCNLIAQSLPKNDLPEESAPAIPRNTDREKSPVFSTKVGFVRRVPVKLNFTNADNFAEEFDGSPPLSLD